MEVKIRYDVSSNVIRKVDGIFPMSLGSMYTSSETGCGRIPGRSFLLSELIFWSIA